MHLATTPQQRTARRTAFFCAACVRLFVITELHLITRIIIIPHYQTIITLFHFISFLILHSLDLIIKMQNPQQPHNTPHPPPAAPPKGIIQITLMSYEF